MTANFVTRVITQTMPSHLIYRSNSVAIASVTMLIEWRENCALANKSRRIYKCLNSKSPTSYSGESDIWYGWEWCLGDGKETGLEMRVCAGVCLCACLCLSVRVFVCWRASEIEDDVWTKGSIDVKVLPWFNLFVHLCHVHCAYQASERAAHAGGRSRWVTTSPCIAA